MPLQVTEPFRVLKWKIFKRLCRVSHVLEICAQALKPGWSLDPSLVWQILTSWRWRLFSGTYTYFCRNWQGSNQACHSTDISYQWVLMDIEDMFAWALQLKIFVHKSDHYFICFDVMSVFENAEIFFIPVVTKHWKTPHFRWRKLWRASLISCQLSVCWY